MKKIPLTQGKFALVDDEDFKWLSQYNWYGSNKYVGYFYSEVEAAKAYDHAAIKYFGQYARTNF